VISRIAYPSHEELITLAVVAGATSTIRLMPTVLVAPVRDPILLAKQAATLDSLSGGRFILGLGTGLREDDFTLTGTSHTGRGKRFDEMLETMHRVWAGDPILEGSREAAPTPTRGDRVPIIFGANVATPRIVRRIARWGEGFMAAGSPAMVAPIIEGVQREWIALERPGRPRLIAASYFTFGGDEEADRTVRDYYSFMPAFGEMATAAMVRTPEIARSYVKHFEDAGFDEFLFSAASTDPSQLDVLAKAVLI
jgi:alkanesulfonate monooxygenase SsuD/methylene tetrahydromethanopterin reductase-like flavin-dependent oxidoreductase (luciferase family)